MTWRDLKRSGNLALSLEYLASNFVLFDFTVYSSLLNSLLFARLSCSLLIVLVSIWTETIVVSVTTGVLGFAGSIPRPLAAGGRLLVSPRSDNSGSYW